LTILAGRKALAAPLCKSSLRSLTIQTVAEETAAVEKSINNHAKETHSIEANINQMHITNSFVPPTADSEASSKIADNYNLMRSIKKRTNKLGSVVSPYYKPHELVMNPPRPKDITLELLLASQAHLGHSTSLWNPANQRYIYGVRQGVHVISLEVIAAHLRRAAKVVEGVAYHGGIILFVGTRPGQASAVVKAAQLAKGCHLFDSWTPGSITNAEHILARCSIKGLDKDDKVVEGIDEKLREWRALKPDLVVVMNPLENYTLLHECGLNNIPTIGVVDTNADPTWVTYPIPANDDRFVSSLSLCISFWPIRWLI
jgi:small subunit ribosomal protein S2